MIPLYRGVEFSKLTFLIDYNHQKKWNILINTNAPIKPYKNWWLRDTNSHSRNRMYNNILLQNNDFFEKSADFNSRVGGRFNPPKSFGNLYCSTSPTMAALEVLYHLFDSSYSIYKSIVKSSEKITTAFNVSIPKSINVMISVFEFSADLSNGVFDICSNTTKFTNFCKDLGFDRYIDTNFNEDFIFGNDYEVTNILGCAIHSGQYNILKTPSARIDLNVQKNQAIHNYIIPEKEFGSAKFNLTGNVREYKCDLHLEEKNGKFEINIQSIGFQNKNATLYLEPRPSKKNNQVKVFSQVVDKDNPENIKKHSREVGLQRYK